MAGYNQRVNQSTHSCIKCDSHKYHLIVNYSCDELIPSLVFIIIIDWPPCHCVILRILHHFIISAMWIKCGHWNFQNWCFRQILKFGPPHPPENLVCLMVRQRLAANGVDHPNFQGGAGERTSKKKQWYFLRLCPQVNRNQKALFFYSSLPHLFCSSARFHKKNQTSKRRRKYGPKKMSTLNSFTR